jgi:hypothetical protein
MTVVPFGRYAKIYSGGRVNLQKTTPPAGCWLGGSTGVDYY